MTSLPWLTTGVVPGAAEQGAGVQVVPPAGAVDHLQAQCQRPAAPLGVLHRLPPGPPGQAAEGAGLAGWGAGRDSGAGGRSTREGDKQPSVC